MSAAKHSPGGQCDECEGFCLVPVTLFQAPVQAVEWSCHAATTIKDANGVVLAEVGGNGRHSLKDEAIAAEIVRLVNTHGELLHALRDYDRAFTEFDVTRKESRDRMRKAVIAARAAIAAATFKAEGGAS